MVGISAALNSNYLFILNNSFLLLCTFVKAVLQGICSWLSKIMDGKYKGFSKQAHGESSKILVLALKDIVSSGKKDENGIG